MNLLDHLIEKKDQLISFGVDIRHCDSICLTLGPYRNLTTLTAAIFFLHPDCQVLNHGYIRLMRRGYLNFLTTPDRNKTNRFLQYAAQLSKSGRKGDYGGSITLSHAFDPEYPMYQAFKAMGGRWFKPNFKCLYWKESQRTGLHLRNHGADLTELLQRDTRLRFLYPIRNPMDCAFSNLKSGHVVLYDALNKNSSVLEVLNVILNEHLWYAKLQTENPDRFHHFFEYELDTDKLRQLAEFLSLEAKPDWLEQAGPTLSINSHYEHDPHLIEYYEKTVIKRFSMYPEIQSGLMRFISDN